MPAIEADILIFFYCLQSTRYKLEAHNCDFLPITERLKFAVVFYFEWKLSCVKFTHNSQHRIKIGNYTIQAKQCWDLKHFSWNQDGTNTLIMGGNRRLKYMRNPYIQRIT